MSTEFRSVNSDGQNFFWVCQTCGAMVPNFGTDRQRHIDFHTVIDAMREGLAPAPFPFQCSICFGPVDADGETCGTCADLANEGVL